MNLCGHPDPCRGSMYCGEAVGHDGGHVYSMKHVDEMFRVVEGAVSDTERNRARANVQALGAIALQGLRYPHTRESIAEVMREIDRVLRKQVPPSSSSFDPQAMVRSEARLRLAVGALRDGEVALGYLVRGLRQLESSDARQIPSILPRSAEDAIATIQRQARVT